MLDPGVVACAHCQQPNWIPAGWSRDLTSCTHCGVVLGARPTGSPPPKHGFTTFLSQTFNALGVAALCALPIASRPELLVASRPKLPVASRVVPAPGQTRLTSQPGLPRAAAPDRNKPNVSPGLLPALPPPAGADSRLAARPAAPAGPPPVAIMEGIVSATRTKPRTVSFQIHAAAGSNYFVKLVNTADAQDITTLYVRGGRTLSLTMPVATLRLSFAAGDIWYGELLKFGPQTTYWTSGQVLTFSRGKLVSIELPERRAVPARSVPLDPRRF